MAALLSDLADRLAPLSDTSFLDASVLLAHILEKPRSWVLAHPELVLSEEQQMKLTDALMGGLFSASPKINRASRLRACIRASRSDFMNSPKEGI